MRLRLSRNKKTGKSRHFAFIEFDDEEALPIVMACVVMGYIVMGCTVMGYTVMAYIVMGYTVMAYIVMAYIVMALHSYGTSAS